MTVSIKPKWSARRGIAWLLVGSIACTSLSGCLLAAGAAAGGAAGYVAGQHSADKEELRNHDDHVVTEERTVEYHEGD